MERTAADRVNDPVIGRLLDGRYRVGPRIARGGMATVYTADDTRLDRPVAVKVMHTGLTDPAMGDDDSFSRRFRREAQAAARLAHPNVVAVFDAGDDDGVLFLVMEYVHGITLRDLIREEAPIPPVKALAVLEPVLAALGSAHAAGMIHRDVKPENVLLSDDGRVKVADFGLARAINTETQHTGTGVLIGTVSYLSPELVVGAGDADARVDVYAAGVLLYEMLTGVKPHQADSPIQVAYKHVHEDIPAPSARQPGLPPYLDALVARATARDAALRPRDANELLGLVRRVRGALEAGRTNDPALVADLLPRPVATDPFTDTDGQMPRVIIDPSEDTGAWSAVQEFGTAFDNGSQSNYAPYTAATQAPSAAHPPEEDPYAAAYERAYQPPGDTGYEHTTNLAGGGPPARTPQQRPARRRRRPLVLLVLALAAALVVGIGAWYLGVARYTTTPGVINLKQSDAARKVKAAGLTFSVAKTAYSESVAAGAVLSTDPDPGSRILKDGTVRAVVSRGPERHAVPDVRGKTLDQAQAAIQDAKLTFGKSIGKYDDKVPKGRVISTSPQVGADLRRDSAVDVTLSKGRKPIRVPDYTGKNGDDAIKALGGLGLKTTSTTAYDDKTDKGDVVRQTPSGGVLYKGDNVTLVISRGPQLVEVPKVTAMGVDAATTLLESRGFKVKTVESDQYLGLGYVLRQSPKAGEMVPKGSTITLKLV